MGGWVGGCQGVWVSEGGCQGVWEGGRPLPLSAAARRRLPGAGAAVPGLSRSGWPRRGVSPSQRALQRRFGSKRPDEAAPEAHAATAESLEGSRSPAHLLLVCAAQSGSSWTAVKLLSGLAPGHGLKAMALSRVDSPGFLLFLLVFQAVFILILYRGGPSNVFRGFLESHQVLDYSKTHDVYTNLSLFMRARSEETMPYCSAQSPIFGRYE